jgi:two-component system nitrate/nitrite response regulator NarL
LSSAKAAVLVSENVLLREGLERILTAAGFRIIASALRADDHVLSKLDREQSILFIINVSDYFDAGLRQVALFKKWYPAGQLVVLADRPQLTGMMSAFRAGANAYLGKVTTCETFVKSLELVTLGLTLWPPEILDVISNRTPDSRTDHVPAPTENGHADGDENVRKHEPVEADVERNEHSAGADSGDASRLSVRERAILRCLTEGDSNKTVARKMAMTEGSVKVHVKTILRKIRVRNRTQAAIWAMSNDPVILERDDAPLASGDFSLEPRPEPDIANVGSETHRNGSTSLAAVKVKESPHSTIPGEIRLVRRRD